MVFIGNCASFEGACWQVHREGEEETNLQPNPSQMFPKTHKSQNLCIKTKKMKKTLLHIVLLLISITIQVLAKPYNDAPKNNVKSTPSALNKKLTNNVRLSLPKPNQPKSQTTNQLINQKTNQQRSLNEILNPDGTLKPNSNGSFNAIGFKMGYGKNGKPVFLPTTAAAPPSDDDNWDNTPSNYLREPVNAIAVYNGNVYVGSDNIYRWNGTKWSILGGGVNSGGTVYAVAISPTGDVYMGGIFTAAGGVATNIAKWNGTGWSALGSGLNGFVYAMAFSGTDLYVGGGFTMAGGVSGTSRIAKWNGTTWSALGIGVANNLVRAITVSATGDVYVGGNFTSAGGLSGTTSIAKWDGAAWSVLGNVLSGGGGNPTVHALAISGSDVYVGGNFAAAGDVSGTSNIAKLNSSTNTWSALGVGVSGPIVSLAVSGTEVYMGGNFNVTGNSSIKYLAKWDGTNATWSAVGGGVDGDAVTPQAIAIAGADVYVGGQFSKAGGNWASRIAKWNGTTWSALGSGIGSAGTGTVVDAVAVSGTDVYVGGGFTIVGGITVNGIAKWSSTTSTWSALGTGVQPTYRVFAIAIVGTDVYAGGSFTSVGGNVANYIAKWNGSEWSSLGTGGNNGVSNYVRCLVASGTDLYVGGYFNWAGGNTSIKYVAKWDGTTWSGLGTGVNSSVEAMAKSGNDLYVGGYFNSAGGSSANNIAKWNGTNWTALGQGTSNTVTAIAISGTDVYVGGQFYDVDGGKEAYGIAKWNSNTNTWSALGLGVVGAYVNAIVVSGTDVYVGGGFTTAYTSVSNYVLSKGFAKWDGTAWSDMGASENASVNALALSGTDLYVGGNFTTAGGKVANSFAIYHTQQTTLPVRLVSYTAKAEGNYAKLQWQTANEQNNKGFEIWRGGDTSTGSIGEFVKIGEVSALVTRNTQPITYNFTDKKPLNGNNYYKLVQIDNNGTATDLGIRTVTFNFQPLTFNLYPNPAQNQLNISIAQAGEILKIYNIQGKKVVQQQLNQTQNSIDITSLPAGVYFYHYGKQTGKFVKAP